jgi:hypothetical protein
MIYPISYKFSQHFKVSAKEAYDWCTDFSPQDPEIMQSKNARRQIIKISAAIVILKDAFYNGDSELVTEKLVHFYPQRLMWVSTHLTGSNMHSQFIYELSQECNDSSKLDFTAVHLENRENLSEEKAKKLAAQLCRCDSKIWRLLALEMEKQLSPRHGKF